MIHHWECDRCTHQWCSSCMGEMLAKPKDKERNHRQLSSGLCWDCFEQLESGEIRGLELFDLAFYLEQKSERYGGKSRYHVQGLGAKYSGMCQEYRRIVFGPDGNTIIDPGNFDGGYTAEESQLHTIVSNVKEVYKATILEQRTPKRIELDEFQKTAGVVFFGEQPRPEGFVGDPPGKSRPEILFGLDLSTGTIDITAPRIKMNDGTQSCPLGGKDELSS